MRRIRPRPEGVPADLGAPVLPGSKSHTQRAMVLAAFSAGDWLLRGALQSEDTELLGTALAGLGAQVSWQDGAVAIRGRGGRPAPAEIFLGENATGLRLLLVVVPALGGTLTVDGRQGLRARPLAPSLDLLKSLGASVQGTRLPITVAGGTGWPLPLEVDASTTTQVASGALLAAALSGGEVRVRSPSAPGYVRVTAAVCRQFGWHVEERVEGNDLVFTVGGSPRPGGEVAIPGDPSARVFVVALAAMHGIDASRVLPRLPDDPHPDWQVDEDLARLLAGSSEPLELAEVGRRPDCLPALAVVAASRRRFTRFVGLPALRKKESDRLRAMAQGLSAAGVVCAELPEGLIVEGPLDPERDGPRVLPAAADHRVVMALSLVGTAIRKGVVVENSSAVGKSWPGFFDWLGRVAVVEAVGNAARR